MIKDLKELQSLLKLCRKQGITEITMADGLHLKFGDMPQNTSQGVDMDDQQPNGKYSGFPDGVLTNDQLAYYSAGGDPAHDPENNN